MPRRRNGGRTQHRLQYLSAFGPDRRFALDSKLIVRQRRGNHCCDYVENLPLAPVSGFVAAVPPRMGIAKYEYLKPRISLVRFMDQGYIGNHRLGTVLDAMSGQAVGPLDVRSAGGPNRRIWAVQRNTGLLLRWMGTTCR